MYASQEDIISLAKGLPLPVVPSPCPACGKGTLVEKSSKRGKIFYSCDQYPQCDYALWDWPVNEHCPECDSPLLVIKTTRARGRHIACPNPKCRYTRELEDRDEHGDA